MVPSNDNLGGGGGGGAEVKCKSLKKAQIFVNKICSAF